MPAERLVLSDSIVLKIEPSGERFTQIRLLNREHGLLSLLKRNRSKTPGSGVDLFDQGEVQIDRKTGENAHFGFLVEYCVSRKRFEIGKSYPALKAAAWLSGLVISNPLHAENSDDTFSLIERALDALCLGHPQCAVMIKTLYVFARDEGYPVLEEWIRNLEPTLAGDVAVILNTPLSELKVSSEAQWAVFESLTRYVQAKTHIHLPNS